MRQVWGVVPVLMLCALAPGCATPPEVKQALVAKDDAYAANIELTRKYETLARQYNDRYRYWNQYVQSRLAFHEALRWILLDPRPLTTGGPGADATPAEQAQV